MQAALAALADPVRRGMIAMLLHGEVSAGTIERALNISQPAASKHLRSLRKAGLVRVRKDAQRRLYRLDPASLAELDAWLAPYRQFWAARLDALEQHLDAGGPT
jgi:DNA-binding transcriptional ArsR family regulator